MSIISILFLLFFPAFLIYLSVKLSALQKIDLIALTFLTGIIFAVTLNFAKPYLFDPLSLTTFKSMQSSVLDISIALALPLLIFSFDIRQAIRSAKPIFFAMLLAIISVITTTVILSFIFKDLLSPIWQYAGMATGAYIGGGVNMAVIKTAITADEAIFITITSYDLALSALYLLFVLTLAKPFVGLMLPIRNRQVLDQAGKALGYLDNKDISNKQLPEKTLEQYAQLIHKKNQKYNFISFMLAAGIVGLSVLLASLFPKTLSATTTIVVITTLSLLVSLFPKIHSLPTSYTLGMYLVMVFCFTIGTMFDFKMFYDANIILVSYLSLLIFGSFILHLLLSKLFRIDRDSFLITSVATIMSLPFIPLICNKLNNKDLLVAGLSVSIIGYILGTYLGIAVGFGLR